MRTTYAHNQEMVAGKITPKQKKVLDFIREFSAERGYAPSQQEIADHFGYKSLGTIQNYLVRLERNGHLKRSWNAKRSLETAAEESRGLELPLFGYVAAGSPIEAIEGNDTLEVPPTMLRGGESFALEVQGDSMIGDGILDGDYVIVRSQKTAQTNQTVVATINGEATVKHYHPLKGAIELRSSNPVVPTIMVEDGDDFRIEGVVIGVIRHLY